MSEVKLTKNELREWQNRLTQLQRYLPTLQLKKALLQAEVRDAGLSVEKVSWERNKAKERAEEAASLLSSVSDSFFQESCSIERVERSSENIAGVEVPVFKDVLFRPFDYLLLDTPIWWEGAVEGMRSLLRKEAHLRSEREKLSLLQKELREVSIRVNLFEKILIPKALTNIKKIRVFLGDQLLAAVARAKVAKIKTGKR